MSIYAVLACVLVTNAVTFYIAYEQGKAIEAGKGRHYLEEE